MKRTIATIGMLGIALLVAVAYVFSRTGDAIEIARAPSQHIAAPEMCPWRNPSADMKALFPGSDTFETTTIVLSAVRPRILQRLGKRGFMDTTALYVYPVMAHSSKVGCVLVQRAPARHGAIEVVVGLDNNNKISGVRIQRQREPDAVAAEISHSDWLKSYEGKDGSAPFEIGEDLPNVSATSLNYAKAIADAVRMVVIQYEEGSRGVKLHGKSVL
ncbi:MAG: hypothetical protein ABJA67_12100 [Chthonomonadales bacterium]